MPRFPLSRALVVAVSLVLVTPTAAASEEAPDDASVCHEGGLARQRTEVDADITVAGFDPALGTLLEVQVPTQVLHLDTDAAFENTAQTAVTFEEHMTYQVVFTSPGGLPSPASVSGTIERVPVQTLAAFDGTLDFLGASAVTQPSTTRDAAASPVSSTDPSVLAAFTGGSVAFHVASTIGETFVGGGGNIEAGINTYAAASVRVCYRYAPPAPPSTTPTTAPVPPTKAPVHGPGTVARAPRRLAFTGTADGWLTAVGIAVLALGVVLVTPAWRRGRSRPGRVIDVGSVDR